MKITKLEAIRGFVALYVIIHHFTLFTPLYSVLPSAVKVLFRFGREAVLVFFLLSGFVICIATQKSKQADFITYFNKRFWRIYPILIASFVLSIVVYCFNGNAVSITIFKSLAANLLQIQRLTIEPGPKIPTFIDNFPLWSLSYEWWFYMLFFPLYALVVKYRHTIMKDIYLVMLLSVVSWLGFLLFPSHTFIILSLFLLWYTGFYCGEIYLKQRDFNFADLKPVLLALAVMIAAIGGTLAEGMFIEHKTIAQISSVYPILHYLFYYIEAFALLAVGLLWWKAKLAGFDTVFGWFARLSPISYALYIVHFPIIQFKITILSNVYITAGVKLLVIFVIAYFLEIIYQPWVMKLYRGVKGKQPVPETVPLSAGIKR